MNDKQYISLEDKKEYLSPEFEIVEIRINTDVLSASGEGPLEPSTVPVVPSEWETFPEDPLDD